MGVQASTGETPGTDVQEVKPAQSVHEAKSKLPVPFKKGLKRTFRYRLLSLNNIKLDSHAHATFCASNIVQPTDVDINKKHFTNEEGKLQSWRPLHKLPWRRVVVSNRFVWLPVFGPITINWLEEQHTTSVADGRSVTSDLETLAFGIKDTSSVVSHIDKTAKNTLYSPKFSVDEKRLVGIKDPVVVEFRWRRILHQRFFAVAPCLNIDEIEYLDSLLDFEDDVRQQRELCYTSSNFIEKTLKENTFAYDQDKKITHVVLLVVVLAEVAPILETLKFQKDDEASEQLGQLAVCYSGKFESYKLTVAKVAESSFFSRHYSGGTQVSGITALVAKIIKPNLVVSFGTAGGIPPDNPVGSVVLANSCLFLDRTRTSSASAFSWGIWGGGTVLTPRLADALKPFKVNYAPCASQISYTVPQLSVEKIKTHHIACLDMEAASEAQILNQMKCNFIAVKVISNGVYPGDPKRMEAEYHDNRELVSKKATEVLLALFRFLDGRTIAEL